MSSSTYKAVAAVCVLAILAACNGGTTDNKRADPAAPAAATTAAATVPATPAGPATSIGDGTWTVGVDIVAGTWRPAVAAGEDCYWAILKSGTNGDIVKNNIGGGRPTVVLAQGQDFETQRCGTWAKQ